MITKPNKDSRDRILKKTTDYGAIRLSASLKYKEEKKKKTCKETRV